METIARHKHARESAQKVRLVADQIRGLSANEALNLLSFSNKKAAALLRKVVVSAIANAEHNAGVDVDELRVSKVMVDAATSMKRMHARAKGRGSRIVKRTCHICVAVSDEGKR